MRAAHIGAVKLGAHKISAIEHSRKQIGAGQIDLTHGAVGEIGARHFPAAQVHIIEIEAPQILQRQIRTASASPLVDPKQVLFHNIGDI
jgi:hypothetical protein